MPNFVKLSDLNSFQLQDVKHSAWELAGNALDLDGNPVDDGTVEGFDARMSLASFLIRQAERWASFDIADESDTSYEAVIAEYFRLK